MEERKGSNEFDQELHTFLEENIALEDENLTEILGKSSPGVSQPQSHGQRVIDHPIDNNVYNNIPNSQGQ